MAGLILPFLLPYCGFRYVLRYAARLSKEEETEKGDVRKNLIDQMEAVCAKIN
jgi:hypothetical protein